MTDDSILTTHRRADPLRLRDEALKAIPQDLHDGLGLKLGAGSDHPRAWVGPPFLYDLIGAMQFQLLIDLGMREHHRFLDVGCGSLRLGRLAMMYLLPERYFGVEPNRDILDRGCQLHFGAPLDESQVIELKRPRFSFNSEFDFGFMDGPADFIFAQSIASHTGVTMTKDLLKAIADSMHDGSIAMVTYIRCADQRRSNTEEGWFYPECVTYTDADFGGFAASVGLNAYRAVWPMSNIRSDGLVTTQQPTILTKTEWGPSLAQRTSAALFSGIIKIS